MPMAYTMSIEPTNAPSFRYGFHLGTNERVARQFVIERFSGRNAYGQHTRSIALLDGYGSIIDVFDGTWASNNADWTAE